MRALPIAAAIRRTEIASYPQSHSSAFLLSFQIALILFDSLLAPSNHLVWNLPRLLRIHFENEHGVGVDSVHDSPDVLRVSNPQCSTTPSNIGQCEVVPCGGAPPVAGESGQLAGGRDTGPP